MDLEPIIANIPRGFAILKDCLFVDGNRCRIVRWFELGYPVLRITKDTMSHLQNTGQQNKMGMDCWSHGSTCRSLDGSVF
ncbi:hypothetical protein RHMOL_Rhmol10G0228500 [Rhododendron molle]|uniref:Uncharacterized protein n=1 Tax=Rhododendron molle TaxID=49168 RepID=A0ACC0M6X8_RHOML|nr:hypothetical protein RHMOL_Rhmol10G0228500 [Rhododendron molle]